MLMWRTLAQPILSSSFYRPSFPAMKFLMDRLRPSSTMERNEEW
jgi:hypothetical protein